MARKRVVGERERTAHGMIPPEVRQRLNRIGGLQELKHSVSDALHVEKAAGLFDAVSDPARLRLLWELTRAPLCPCLLRELEPMADSALSYHLRRLRRAGLVVVAASSNYRVYEATDLGKQVIAFARQAMS